MTWFPNLSFTRKAPPFRKDNRQEAVWNGREMGTPYSVTHSSGGGGVLATRLPLEREIRSV